jgi:hypothetical protein
MGRPMRASARLRSFGRCTGVRNGWADTYSSDCWFWASANPIDPTRIHSADGTLTATTRPTFSTAVRYFQRRTETVNLGWGINVNHSESLSNSHQPQTYPSRVRRKKIGRWNVLAQFLRPGMRRPLVSICTTEPGVTMGSKVRSRLPMTPRPNRAGKVPLSAGRTVV